MTTACLTDQLTPLYGELSTWSAVERTDLLLTEGRGRHSLPQGSVHSAVDMLCIAPNPEARREPPVKYEKLLIFSYLAVDGTGSSRRLAGRYECHGVAGTQARRRENHEVNATKPRVGLHRRHQMGGWLDPAPWHPWPLI